MICLRVVSWTRRGVWFLFAFSSAASTRPCKDTFSILSDTAFAWRFSRRRYAVTRRSSSAVLLRIQLYRSKLTDHILISFACNGHKLDIFFSSRYPRGDSSQYFQIELILYLQMPFSKRFSSPIDGSTKNIYSLG